MALVTKNDVTQIFAIQAPSVDLPPTFANYPRGWDTARSNNGKPTIKQFNYIQQRTDQNVLWIHQNGGALPYDAAMEYAENAHVVKDGELQKKDGASWVSATNKGYNLDYFVPGKSYPLHAEIMLENGDIVKSTVPNNTANPNLDMTGWLPDNSMKYITNISDLKNYKPLKNDQIVKLLNYDDNVQSVFNDYIYRASSNLDDNYGTVISSSFVDGRWLMLPKSEYVPEDFGVLSGEVAGANNTVRCKNFLESGLNLRIPAKKYKMVGLLSVAISKPTRIVGQSMHSSILDNLKIVMDEGSQGSEFRNFRINTNSLNYSIYIVGGGYSVFDHLYFYHNYDGICTYTTTREVIGNVVSNCISEKSGRIGFTADFGAVGTTFINNTAIDCRQGFHFEGDVRSTALNSKAIRCGLGSPTGTGEQDSYAGPLRSYGTKDLTVDGFENIDPAGVYYWQHGGGGNNGSSNLVFKNFKGVGVLILDDSIETTTNMHFENMPANFGIFRSSNKQIMQGRIVIKNVVGVGDLMVGGSSTSDVYLEDAKTGRLQIGCGNLFLHNVQATTQHNHSLTANNIVGTGLLENNQTVYQETHGGFTFDMTICERIILESLKLRGVNGGIHLGFLNLNRFLTKKIDLGNYLPDVNLGIMINGSAAFPSVDFSKYNIQYNDAQRVYRGDVVPTSGIFQVGDVVYKTVVSADTIYGWVCATGGLDTDAIWKPLKHSA